MKSSSPPKWALRFLQWICPEHLLEEIEGDLIQRFDKDLKIVGEKKAKRRFIWNALLFFRLGILLRNNFSAQLNQLPMFKNYFKTSYRHILNSKLNFAFKLGGLTITLLSFLIIAIYISFQHSFDRYHNDFENIYRINSERKKNGKQERYAIVPMALGTMMQGRFPEVAALTRYRGSNQRFVRYNQKIFSCDILQVDSSFFNVFSTEFVAGNKDS